MDGKRRAGRGDERGEIFQLGADLFSSPENRQVDHNQPSASGAGACKDRERRHGDDIEYRAHASTSGSC